MASVAGRGGAAANRRHTRAAERLDGGTVRTDGRQRNSPARQRGLRYMDARVFSGSNCRLEIDLGELALEFLFQEPEEGGVAAECTVVEIAADRNLAAPGNPAHVLDDSIEGALSPAKRPHFVVRLAIAVERDLHTPQAERQQSIDYIFSEEQ